MKTGLNNNSEVILYFYHLQIRVQNSLFYKLSSLLCQLCMWKQEQQTNN